MPSFSYRAINQLGALAKGQIDAANEIDLELRLGRMGMDLIGCKLVKATPFLFNIKKISDQDLMLFCFQLSQMMHAGVTLIEALNDLKEVNSHSHFQKMLNTLIADIESGKMLSEALLSQPNIFSQIFVGLVAAGEKAGQLPQVFSHLAQMYKWQLGLISQIKRLVSYPLFVLLVVLSAVVFLMIYLVPQMISFLNNMGQTLPIQTKILIYLSNLIVHYWGLFLALLILILFGSFWIIQKNDSARSGFDKFKIRCPVIGVIFHKIIIARFTRYFALMYQSGIPVLDAIGACEQMTENSVVVDALKRIQNRINTGQTLSDSFHGSDLFPALVVRMIRVGESSGSLDQSLLHISDFYDRDVNDSIEKMLKLLEPILTVILGFLLAFIMFSILGPVYDSFSQLRI